MCVTILVFVREYDVTCESKYALFPKRPLILVCSSSCISGGERVLCSAEVKVPSATEERSASLTVKKECVETSSFVAAPTDTPGGHPDPGVTVPALGGCADTEAFATTDRSLGGRNILHG